MPAFAEAFQCKSWRCDGARRGCAGEDLVRGSLGLFFGRRLGAPFFFFGLRGFAKTDSRPCVVPSAFLADGSLSLACARESNQREHTLGVAPALCAGSLRAAGVRLTAIPGLQRNERDPSRSPARCAGLFRPPFAAAQRDPRSRAEPQQRSLRRFCSCFCGQDGRALLLPGPSRPRRGRVGKSPKGRAHDARAFAVGTRMCRQRTSAAASRSRRARCPATAAARVPFSLVTFSWASKRK